MKILFTNTALALLSVAMLLSSCSKLQKKERSQKTGIVYNNKNHGGYVKFRQTHPAPGPGLVAIEGGTFVMGGSADQDVTYEYNNVRTRKTIPSFYMDETEVSNQDWIDYLHWISMTFPDDRRLYYDALPDTLVWRSPLSYNEPYVDNYLRHPAFQDYPVVGVTWEQAQEYCSWRTDRVNENILESKGILPSAKDKARGTQAGTTAAAGAAQAGSTDPFNTDMYLNGQQRGANFDGKKMIKDINARPQQANAAGGVAAPANGKAVRPARMEDGILKPAYRLPSEAEWGYAALSLAGNTQYENINDGKIYPWNGLGTRSPKKKTRGLMLANFKRGIGDNAGVGGSLNDKADITAPVRAYQPNDFGLYNMAGNVNEWVQDTYRQASSEESDDFNPFRGNQFTDKQLADASKGLYAKDKYGKPIKVAATGAKKMTYDELVASQGGQTQVAPTPVPAAPGNVVANGVVVPATAPAKDALAGKPYTPDARDFKDSIDPALYGTTTLVSNKSKVYKGGSWNDLAYWLNPATRRFKNQDEASAEIGFRCAMTMVGAPEIDPSGKSHFSVKKPKAYKP